MSEMRINSGGSRERRLTEELAVKDAEIARLVGLLNQSRAYVWSFAKTSEDVRAQAVLGDIDDALAETGKK
jgi:hypothetical protein